MDTPSATDQTIILIGPEGAGKSTIGALLGAALAKPLFSLDRHRDALYAPYGYDAAAAKAIYEEQGLWPFYKHWCKFEYLAVENLLQNAREEGQEYWGRVLDFGAGHSVLEDEGQLQRIEGLMTPYRNVVLVLPCEDKEEALRVMEERRGKELGLNRHFLEHHSNKRLAKHVVYTQGKTAEESVQEVLGLLNGVGGQKDKA